jgi:hypothetical protein
MSRKRFFLSGKSLNIGLDPDYQAWLDRGTSLSYGLPTLEKQLIENDIVLQLKGSGVWEKMDIIYFLGTWGSANLATLNLKNPITHQITTSGAVTHTPGSGYKGNGGFLDTNYNASTDAVNYQLNNAYRGMYVKTAFTTNSQLDGINSSNANRLANLNGTNQRINQGPTNNLSAAADLSGTGYKSIQRNSSSSVILFSGDTKITRSATSTAITSGNQLILRSNTTNGDAELSFYMVGEGLLTDTQQIFLSDLFDAFINESELPSFNAGDELLDNHSYSWWVKPISIFDETTNRNYFTTVGGGTSGIGNQNIHYLSNTTSRITSMLLNSEYTRDEHNTSAFLIREGHILCAYTGHNSSTFWIHKVTKNLASTISKVDIHGDVGFSSPSYAQLYEFELEGGVKRVILFTRNTASTWAYTYSDDDGDTWVSAKTFISGDPGGGLFYIAGQKKGNTIKFFATRHPDNTANRLYIFEINGITGDVSTLGSFLGNIYDSGYSNFNRNDMTAIIVPPSGESWRVLDITSEGGFTFLLLGYFDDTSSQAALHDGDYILYKINESDGSIDEQINIVAHGKDTYSTYLGGAYFVQTFDGAWNGEIYLAREELGIWYVEKYNYASGVVSFLEEIENMDETTDELSLTRPQPPLDSTLGGLKVIYQKGDYNNSFTSWVNKLIGIK